MGLAFVLDLFLFDGGTRFCLQKSVVELECFLLADVGNLLVEGALELDVLVLVAVGELAEEAGLAESVAAGFDDEGLVLVVVVFLEAGFAFEDLHYKSAEGI